jgi:hypothetical protein
MQDTEAQQLLLSILELAEKGKYTEFRFITSWAEFKSYWYGYRSTKLIIKTLREASENLFKTYCREVSTGSADVNNLFAFAQLRDIIAFYEKELATVKRMLDDYDDYLGHGNFWYSFLGGERTLPWNTI